MRRPIPGRRSVLISLVAVQLVFWSPLYAFAASPGSPEAQATQSVPASRAAGPDDVVQAFRARVGTSEVLVLGDRAGRFQILAGGGGFLGGLLQSILPKSSKNPVVEALLSGAGGALKEVLGQIVSGKKIDWKKIGLSALNGVLQKLLSNWMQDSVANGIGSAATSILGQLLSGGKVDWGKVLADADIGKVLKDGLPWLGEKLHDLVKNLTGKAPEELLDSLGKKTKDLGKKAIDKIANLVEKVLGKKTADKIREKLGKALDKGVDGLKDKLGEKAADKLGDLISDLLKKAGQNPSKEEIESIAKKTIDELLGRDPRVTQLEALEKQLSAQLAQLTSTVEAAGASVQGLVAQKRALVLAGKIDEAEKLVAAIEKAKVAQEATAAALSPQIDAAKAAIAEVKKRLEAIKAGGQ